MGRPCRKYTGFIKECIRGTCAVAFHQCWRSTHSSHHIPSDPLIPKQPVADLPTRAWWPVVRYLLVAPIEATSFWPCLWRCCHITHQRGFLRWKLSCWWNFFGNRSRLLLKPLKTWNFWTFRNSKCRFLALYIGISTLNEPAVGILRLIDWPSLNSTISLTNEMSYVAASQWPYCAQRDNSANCWDVFNCDLWATPYSFNGHDGRLRRIFIHYQWRQFATSVFVCLTHRKVVSPTLAESSSVLIVSFWCHDYN